jgi:CCR4-NOT transcription complex subunit 6
MVDGRVVAAVAAAAALGRLTVTWLRRRPPQARSHGRAQPRHRARLLPRGRPLPSGPSELSLVSYNILCQKYATGRRFPHVFAQYLDPKYRWERLQAELAAFGADLVALQEVTIDR